MLLHNDDVNDRTYVVSTIVELTTLNEQDATTRMDEADKTGFGTSTNPTRCDSSSSMNVSTRVEARRSLASVVFALSASAFGEMPRPDHALATDCTKARCISLTSAVSILTPALSA